MTKAELSYCAREVHRLDNDRFLAALFAPPDRREDLFALYAFNIEVAKTREVVTEPMLGQIRLQWWRDSIARLHEGEAPRHEVIQPLAAAVIRHGLDRSLMERLIDAREADLEDRPPASLDCLVNYAEVTSAPLVQLALAVLGVRNEAAMAAGRHVGIAWALVGLLRAVPHHARAHRLYLPADLLDAQGVTETALFEMRPEPGLSTVVRAVADLADEHLGKARALRSQVPRAALPALLPAALADLSLRTLKAAGYDPFAPRVQMPHPLRQILLAWRALTGRW